MKIRVNGEACEIQAANLIQALVELGYTDVLVATALNGDFVPRGRRPQINLTEGDRLEILAPMEGG